MLERELVVVNTLGLHARAATRLVNLLSGFQSRVTLSCRGRSINAKSILGVMLLAASRGTRLQVRIEGADAAEAMAAIVALFASGFDEGQAQ